MGNDKEITITERVSNDEIEMINIKGATLDSVDTDSLEVVIDKFEGKEPYSYQKYKTVMRLKMSSDFVMSGYTLDQKLIKNDSISFGFMEDDPLYHFLNELIKDNNSMRIYDDKSDNENKYVEFRKSIKGRDNTIYIVFNNDKNENYKWYITVNKNSNSKSNIDLKVRLEAFFNDIAAYFYEKEMNKTKQTK